MNFSKLKNQDWIITAVVALLLLLGSILIYSTTFNATSVPEGAGSLAKQLVFIILGLGTYFMLIAFDISWLKLQKVQIVLYFLILALLVVVLFTDPINNARRWINIGFINIQPSEFAKIVLILLTAGIFAGGSGEKPTGLFKIEPKKKSKTKESKLSLSFLSDLFQSEAIKRILTSLVVTAPIIVLIFIQPAFGSSVIVFFIWLSLLFAVVPGQFKIISFLIISFLVSASVWRLFTFKGLYDSIGINLIVGGFDLGLIVVTLVLTLLLVLASRIKLVFVPIAIVIAVTLIPGVKVFNERFLTDYQRQRIETFFNPEADVQGSGWQVSQSKIAIGSGRVFGRGFLQGTQSRLRFLPFAHTDFIFAALGEQFGLVGCVFVLGLFALLISRILRVASNTKDTFGTIVAIGVATMLLLHVFINVGMNLGKLPVTGIPLPLVSYGGSSVLVNLIALGIVQSIISERKAVDSSEHLMVLSDASWRD